MVVGKNCIPIQSIYKYGIRYRAKVTVLTNKAILVGALI